MALVGRFVRRARRARPPRRDVHVCVSVSVFDAKNARKTETVIFRCVYGLEPRYLSNMTATVATSHRR